MKILITVALTVVAILGASKLAIRNYQSSVIHARARQADASNRPEAQASSGTAFEGDLFARSPQSSAPRSTPAEDRERARQAASWVRVVFEGDAHPKFVALVQSALQQHWNTNLGYQLVFDPSRGPLEEAATAVTLRLKLQAYTSPFQLGNQPEVQQFFRAVELIAYPNPRQVPSSWDQLHVSVEKALPQHFSLNPQQAESFNRERLGYLYQSFAKELAAIPPFYFFPDPQFDAIRDLYTWPAQTATNSSPVDPAVFAETAERLVKNYNRPLYREHLDAICCHLLAANATNCVDGIATVLSGWLPHVTEERLQLLRTHLGFADYALMKTLLRHRQGYLLFRNIPEVWTDPGLAEFSRAYWREKKNSSDLGWMAHEFADKLATPAQGIAAQAAQTPAKTPRILFVTAQNQPSRPGPVPSVSSTTNRASVQSP